VLKKAGIVAAATAATLLVLSPLAYAGGSPQEKHHGHGTEQSGRGEQDDPPGGLIDDIDVLSNLNVCPDVNVSAALGNVLGILGIGGASTSTADAPINCTVTSTDH
jgi:hypothetical protein